MPPPQLLLGLNPQQQQEVAAWWQSVPLDMQAELAIFWDRQADSCVFSYVSEEADSQWQELPILIGARFLPKDEIEEPDASWNIDLYEYLINHPELAIHHLNRTFHICSAHPQARAAVAKGVISSNYVCPLAHDDCPMNNLLALSQGRGIAFFSLCKREPTHKP